MPLKKIAVPKGFLTLSELEKKAREKGIKLSSNVMRTRLYNARKGKGSIELIQGVSQEISHPKKRYLVSVEGAQELIDRELKLKKLRPKGTFTTKEISLEAKRQGVNLPRSTIDSRVRRALQGKGPKSDLKGVTVVKEKGKRTLYFFDETAKKRFIRQAKVRKLKPSEVSAVELGVALGLKDPYVISSKKHLRKKGITKKRGNRVFVSEADFKRLVNESVARWPKYKRVKALRDELKRRQPTQSEAIKVEKSFNQMMRVIPYVLKQRILRIGLKIPSRSATVFFDAIRVGIPRERHLIVSELEKGNFNVKDIAKKLNKLKKLRMR